MRESAGLPQHNPFSPTAVARIEMAGDIPVTIATPAVEAAMGHLAGYLRSGTREQPAAGPVDPGDGTILAVVGDYGTGKTHLAIHLLREAQREQAAARKRFGRRIVVHPTYLEASAGGFRQLYRNFVSRLNRAELLETIRDYYADIVADVLSGSEYTMDTVRDLRDGVLEPESVVEGLGLIDSQLSIALREQLIEVTRVDAFGIALTMLLRRKEFADDIWSWLTGSRPTPALVQRGIVTQISSEELALEAMGVFAHLYGRRQHRFVLVIDELDKILTGSKGPIRGVIGGFKKLFEVFHAAGGFLVVVGLPDLFDMLGESVRQRVGRIIDMTRMGEDEVRRLIEATHGQAFRHPAVEPFAAEAPALIAKLTDGTTRQVVRLCHRAYAIAIDRDDDVITAETIVEAARNPEGFPTLENIRAEVRRVLNGEGLAFERGHVFGVPAYGIDFWVAVGSGGAGCAIMLTDSVVTGIDAGALASRAREIRAEIEGTQVILVIVCYLNGEFREQLTSAFGRDPVEYGRYNFSEDLRGALLSARNQIEHWQGADVLGQMRERLDLVHRQQTHVQDSIDRLTLRLGELGVTLDQLPGAIHRERRGGLPPDAGTAAPRLEPGQAESLPQPIEEIFEDASRALARFVTIEAEIRASLNFAAPSVDLERRQRTLRARLGTEAVYPAVGTARLLRVLVDEFRSAVVDLYDQYLQPGADRDAAEIEERLTALCYSYEAIQDHLIMSTLDNYSESTGISIEEYDGEFAQWATIRQRFHERFEQLGHRVRETTLPLLTGLGDA